MMFGDIYEVWIAEQADFDPIGHVAKRVEKYLAENGLSAIFGPEIEFFLFERFDLTKLYWDLWVSPNGGAGDSWFGARQESCQKVENLKLDDTL